MSIFEYRLKAAFYILCALFLYSRNILKQDPHHQREARNYDNPIASREYLLEIINQQTVPISTEHVLELLKYDDEERCEAVRRRLNAMARDGQVFKNRRGGFLSFEHMDLEKGYVQAHPDGFGFLTPESGGKDVFLPAREMRKLMNGDRAAVKITGYDDRRERKEGHVISVLERAHQSVVGRYYREKGIHFVIPDDKRLNDDILLSQDYDHNARQGDIVLVRILEYPDQHNPPIGMIESILGQENAPGMEVTIALNTHSIPHKWNDAVIEQVKKIPAEVAEADKKGRLDLRDKPFVTIDGADARDFDDAVYCEGGEGGFRLYVAIADVSHYVLKDSPIDQEAVERGTSVYFPGEVIPMLPEVLSNGLCSLNPRVDRLVMVCEMEIGSAGAIKSYKFHEAIIHSHARLIYDQVADFLFEDKPDKTCEPLRHALQSLKFVYQALAKARRKRHAIEFDTKEVVFEYNEQRKIEDIHPYARNEAHMLIEECMIAANICAARYLKKVKVPALYRIHEGPNPDKVPGMIEFLSAYGVRMTGLEPTPQQYAEALEQIRERPEFDMIQTVMLRSLLQASYSPDTRTGHFGLALNDYAHFTSPIRRYPDLLVHRAIRHVLQGGDKSNYAFSLDQMTALGESCSRYERRADEATRDAADWLKCEYLQKHVGDEFAGLVTSVTGFGLFVQIENLMIEGLVHVTALKRDYYQFDAVHHRLVGEKTGRIYQLGDLVTVQVARVDMDDRKIDFDLVRAESAKFIEEQKPAGRKKRASKKTSRKLSSGNKGKSKTGKKRRKK
jgi:ribonuclease R